MAIRLIVVSVLNSPEHIRKNLSTSRITSYGQTKANLTYLDRMGNGEGRVRSKMHCKTCWGQ